MNILILVYNITISVGNRLFPKLMSAIRFKKVFGRYINWKHPKDINEKIQWLKFHSDTAEWSRLADKYKVREFVAERVGNEYLVDLYGAWDTPEEIDYSGLPNSFVLKTNHGAGTIILVRNKEELDYTTVNSKLSKWLKKDFSIINAEPHYSKIDRKIIAEELLCDNTANSSSLVDYKIWCFNGEVFATWCCFNRNGFCADTEWHDIDWNYRPEWSVFTEHYRNGGGVLPKPKNYEKMLEIASVLSKGFPQVRVDLYNIDGRIYFGELTFTAAGGCMNFYSQTVLEELGKRTLLPV